VITIAQSQRIFGLVRPPLKTVCAWCRLTMREGPEQPVSHTTCAACAEQFESGGTR
jgi:hypothetical protein